MFEKEIKFIADFNLNKIKNLGSFITFERISNSDVHPSIIQYISAELDFLINEDRTKLLQQSLFDYSGAEVSRYFSLIAQEIKKTKKIAYEDLKNLIIQAVSFNINYIVRPKWSLSKLIYNDTETKPVDEIKLLLNYIYYYDYIKKIFISYLSKRRLFSLSITEFESILNKIDKELFSSQPQKLVDNTLYTIGEFFNVGGVNKVRVSPVTIELFLREKNMIDYLFRLRKAVPNGTKQKLNIDELRSVLYSTTPIEKNEIFLEEETIETEPENNSVQDTKIELEIDEETPDQQELEEVEEVKKVEEVKEAEEEHNLFTDIVSENKEDEETIKPEIKEAEISEENIDKPEIKETEISEENIDKPEEDLIDKEMEIDTGIDEDLLSMYDKEFGLDEEKKEESISQDSEENPKVSSGEDIDSLYNFEEESKELLEGFNEGEKKLDEKEEFEEKETESFNKSGEEINENKSFEDLLNEEEKSISPGDAEQEFKSEENEDKEDFIEKAEEPRRKEKDIIDFINPKDIEKIVSSVFNEDREDFANTLEKLTECISYDEATEILKSVFLTYRVNPYSRDAVNLTNAVSNYFDQG